MDDKKPNLVEIKGPVDNSSDENLPEPVTTASSSVPDPVPISISSRVVYPEREPSTSFGAPVPNPTYPILPLHDIKYEEVVETYDPEEVYQYDEDDENDDSDSSYSQSYEESSSDSSEDDEPPVKKIRGHQMRKNLDFMNSERPSSSLNQGHSRDQHGWTKDVKTIPVQPFEGREPHGPTINRPTDDNALAYFLNFFPMFLFSKIAKYTNRAVHKNPSFAKKTTPEEIKAWFGIRIIQGVHSNTNRDDDWSTHPGLRNPLVASTMTRARFTTLSEALTCSKHPEKGGPKKVQDPLAPLRIIWDTVNDACKLNYNPRQELCLDEVTIKANMKQPFTHQNSNGPNSNIFAVCEASTGYLLHMTVLTDIAHKKHMIPLKLMQPFLGKYHRLYCGEKYTSTALAKDLLVNQTYLCGAIRPNAKGLSDEFYSRLELGYSRNHLMKMMLKSPRGTMKTWQQGQMTLALWRGVKVMSLLSTCHQGYRDQLKDFVSRNIKEKGEETTSRRSIPAPPQAIDFCKYKAGVEHSNQLRSYQSCNRQFKAWKRILFFLIDVARVNAWLSYKAFREGETDTPMVPHRMFTVNIAMSLIAGFAEGSRAYQASIAPVPAVNGPNHVCIRMKVKYAKMCLQCRRTGRTTEKGNPINTRTGCSSCNIHLCRGRCFLEFHSAAE